MNKEETIAITSTFPCCYGDTRVCQQSFKFYEQYVLRKKNQSFILIWQDQHFKLIEITMQYGNSLTLNPLYQRDGGGITVRKIKCTESSEGAAVIP